MILGFVTVCVGSEAATAQPAKTAAPAFYRVAKRNGVWWFVAPDGKPFFSLGADCVDTGEAKVKYRSDNPGYAAFRYYPNDAAWAQSTLARLRSWGFNTLGAWSDVPTLKAVDTRMPYTVELELGGSTHVPWCDMFSPEIACQFDSLARKQVLPLRDDPQLLGYFSDNELGWWDDTLFVFFLGQPASNATHRVLLRLLHTHYGGSFARLQRDFDTGAAKDFAALERHPTLTLKPGAQGMEVVNQFTYLVAERYYRLAHDAIRHYDKRHLILGDRYADWYPQAVARAARPYVDVISTNYGADWTDGSNARFYLDTLHRLTGKPILITEFYFCAMQNRSGNKNTSAGFPTVPTQQERAEGFRTNLRAFAQLPYVIGAHWFQYYDEPTKGRGDGENYNMGLVDIADQPYEEMTAAVASLPLDVLHRQSVASTPRSEVFLPPAPEQPEAGLRDWEKERAFVPSTAHAAGTPPCADLYACWDAGYLYLAVYAADYADPSLYKGRKIPSSERMEWTLTLGTGNKPVRVRFGADGKATVVGAAIPCKTWERSTLFTALLALPASALDQKALQAGERIRLRATLTTHSRAERTTWDTTLHL